MEFTDFKNESIWPKKGKKRVETSRKKSKNETNTVGPRFSVALKCYTKSR